MSQHSYFEEVSRKVTPKRRSLIEETGFCLSEHRQLLHCVDFRKPFHAQAITKPNRAVAALTIGFGHNTWASFLPFPFLGSFMFSSDTHADPRVCLQLQDHLGGHRLCSRGGGDLDWL